MGICVEIEVDDEVAQGRLKVWTRRQWRQSDELDSQEQAEHVRRLVAAAKAGAAGTPRAIAARKSTDS